MLRWVFRGAMRRRSRPSPSSFPYRPLPTSIPPARPKIDCTKPGNQNKPACKNKHGELSDDEIYNAAYWMARKGQYREALALLARAKNHDDPRVLNATGFATRKLGDVDGALPYYARALEINPNYAVAREYLGEAFLAKGDLRNARAQLGEIETALRENLRALCGALEGDRVVRGGARERRAIVSGRHLT